MVNGRHRHVVVVLWDAVKAKARDFKFLSPAKKGLTRGTFIHFLPASLLSLISNKHAKFQRHRTNNGK
jgi:hypothetical protein